MPNEAFDFFHMENEKPLPDLTREYMNLLLECNRNKAHQVIRDALRGGLSIPDLYLTIFQPVQYELGRLWLFNKISGAEEHFCTAATQALMLELYPDIISSSRSGMTLVAACAGPELHEIGIRMVADFFEMDGWDTWYLGSAVSVGLLVSAIVQRKPDLVALSVTMSSHVGQVKELINAIKGAFTGTAPPIMVGGVIFNTIPDLWRVVGADLWAINAEQAVLAARELLPPKIPEQSENMHAYTSEQ